MRQLDIALEWDGQSETATLWVDGKPTRGTQRDVDHVFELLCQLRDSEIARGRILDDLMAKVKDTMKRVERMAGAAKP